MKFSYNLFRSGDSFYYRDIFSGLSNETMGAASIFRPIKFVAKVFSKYNLLKKFTPFLLLITSIRKIIRCFKSNQETKKNFLASTVSYYFPLLERYAIRIVSDTDLAFKIVTDVLEHQYDLNRLVTTQKLRETLKDQVLKKCLHDKILSTLPQTYAKNFKPTIVSNKDPMKGSYTLNFKWLKQLFERKPKNPT